MCQVKLNKAVFFFLRFTFLIAIISGIIIVRVVFFFLFYRRQKRIVASATDCVTYCAS